MVPELAFYRVALGKGQTLSGHICKRPYVSAVGEHPELEPTCFDARASDYLSGNSKQARGRLSALIRRTQWTDIWVETLSKIARMILTTKLDWNWSSFQLANSASPLSVTDSAIAPSARMHGQSRTATPIQVHLSALP